MYDSYDTAMYAASSSATADVMSNITIIMQTMAYAIGVIAIIQIISMWKIFTKAGEKGWKAIIPIYNLITLYKISGVSPWLVLLYFLSVIPVVGWLVTFILTIYVYSKLSKLFGKDIGYTLGLIFLTPIFFAMLAFGSAEYVGTNENADNTNNTDDSTPTEI